MTLWYRAPDVLLGSTMYSTNIDLWSIGCIFAELVSGRPLFPGSDMPDQLVRIFKLLGTPNTQSWPGLEELEGWKSRDPVVWGVEYQAIQWERIVPDLEAIGRDLLRRLLTFAPEQRISATDALEHVYFDSIRDAFTSSSSSSNDESSSNSSESYSSSETSESEYE